MRWIASTLALLCLLPAVAAQTTFAVTVETKTAQHPYNGQGHPAGYVIDSEQGRELTLVRGQTYTFQLSNVSSVHPFVISTSEVGGGAGTYTDGVTGSGAIGDGTLVFTVPEAAPDVLWYQCDIHQRMGWRINVVSSTDTEAAADGFGLRLESENPARGAVRLGVTVPASQAVFAEVIGADGRQVGVLLDEVVPAGTVRLTLDGAALPAGVYVVRVRAEGWQGEQRVTIVR
ncbi:MAG: hypothetical protein AAF845_13810 [Bacteroidota bacterium]